MKKSILRVFFFQLYRLFWIVYSEDLDENLLLFDKKHISQLLRPFLSVLFRMNLMNLATVISPAEPA